MVFFNIGGDSVEHSSVTLNDPHDCVAFQRRNALLALIVESGSAEVVEGANETVVLLLF